MTLFAGGQASGGRSGGGIAKPSRVETAPMCAGSVSVDRGAGPAVEGRTTSANQTLADADMPSFFADRSAASSVNAPAATREFALARARA